MTQLKSDHLIVHYNISIWLVLIIQFLAVVLLKEIQYWCFEGCHYNRHLFQNILPNFCNNSIRNQFSNLTSIVMNQRVVAFYLKNLHPCFVLVGCWFYLPLHISPHLCYLCFLKTFPYCFLFYSLSFHLTYCLHGV